MTDKQQPDPLALADEAWNFDCSEYRGARHANAAMMGKLQDCATAIRLQHAELETLTLYKNMADEYGLSIFPDIAEMTAELETLRAKLKTYEDLGDAADNVQEDAFKLLDEVAQCFTTDDGLPDNLLPRIDAVIAARAAQEGKSHDH